MNHDELWRQHGACSKGLTLWLFGLSAHIPFDSDLWFPERGRGATARRICASCPVALDCLLYAIDRHEEFGVWGGAGEPIRRFLGQTRTQHGERRFRIDLQDHLDRLEEFGTTGVEPEGPARSFGPNASHGRASTYGRGCRCDECRVAKIDQQRAAAARAASDDEPTQVAR